MWYKIVNTFFLQPFPPTNILTNPFDKLAFAVSKMLKEGVKKRFAKIGKLCTSLPKSEKSCQLLEGFRVQEVQSKRTYPVHEEYID